MNSRIKKSNESMSKQLEDEGIKRKMRVSLDGEYYDVEAITTEEAEKIATKMRDDKQKALDQEVKNKQKEQEELDKKEEAEKIESEGEENEQE